jgi:hypothetical protein
MMFRYRRSIRLSRGEVRRPPRIAIFIRGAKRQELCRVKADGTELRAAPLQGACHKAQPRPRIGHVHTGRTVSLAHARASSRAPAAQRRRAQDAGSDGARACPSFDRAGTTFGSGTRPAHRAATPQISAMIGTAISPAAFDALAATLPLGSVAFEPQLRDGAPMGAARASKIRRLAGKIRFGDAVAAYTPFCYDPCATRLTVGWLV